MTAATAKRDPLATGLTHHRKGDLGKAEAAYRRALAKSSGDGVALNLLGLVALDRGKPERALQLIDKALKCAPDNADFLHSAGAAAHAAGGLQNAAEYYRAALAIDPARVITRSNLGNVLKHLGRFEDAATELTEAVKTDPGFAAGWSNLGLVHKAAGDISAGLEAFTRAAGLEPGNPEIRFNLANALAAHDSLAEAEAEFARVIALNPGHVRAHVNFAGTLKRRGDATRARTHLETAVSLAPDNAEAQWNLALSRLGAGEWAAGFAGFENRLALPDYALPPLGLPRWDGSALSGGILVIQHEQGLGDAIQFLRFAGPAAHLGARVVYRGPAALRELALNIDGVSEVQALDDPSPEADAFAPMMSLPHILGLRDGESFWHGAYLTPAQERVAAWRKRIAGTTGVRIGIAWQGNPTYRGDGTRSIPLAQFEALARIEGLSLIALQKGTGTEQLSAWPEGLPLLDLGPELDADGAAFMDTAAVIANLDAVVTSDTALAHLAGAMGANTHVALAHVPDWRWGLEGTGCVWYPTMTLHRQARPGDWGGVFARLSETLQERIARNGP